MRRIFKIFLLLAVLIVSAQFFLGCVDYQDNCRDKTKWIIVYNTHLDPYRLLIDDLFIAIVQPEDSIVHDIDYGYYNFKFIQESGYDSIPEIIEENLNVDS